MLVDYSSSESSEEEEEPDSETRNIKKIKLPSAAELLNCAKNESTDDDPRLHGGRVRSFAHERGNWASYCYFKLEAGSLIGELRTAIQDCCREEGIPVDLQDIEELHLSMTRTFVLRHHWIDSFIKDVQESLRELRSKKIREIAFDSIKVFENEEKTRTFIALGVNNDGYPFLNGIVKKLDKCLSEFNLPSFYEDPDYHASFLWCLGSFGKDLQRISDKLNEILYNLIISHSIDELLLPCDNVNCKIGNKLYKIPLLQ